MPHQLLRAAFLAVAASLPVLTAGCELFETAPQPAPAPAPQPAPAKPLVADEVVVLKSQHLLELRHDGKVFATFPVSLGEHSQGPKRQAGDGRTPEGVYRIDGRSERTKYTRALHISYPSAQDRARAQAMHVESGGGIYIHGVPRDYGPYDPPVRFHDWTDGCIAVGNAAIVKIWDAVPDGTPIDIRP
jgi:murein L,D-transpeptidase YafK